MFKTIKRLLGAKPTKEEDAFVQKILGSIKSSPEEWSIESCLVYAENKAKAFNIYIREGFLGCDLFVAHNSGTYGRSGEIALSPWNTNLIVDAVEKLRAENVKAKIISYTGKL